MGYRVFTRRWWKDDKTYPGGLAPDPQAEKHTIAHVTTEDEARAMCDEYNTENSPGRYSVKAEYEEE